MRTKIDIKETERELKRLLSRENDSKIRDKLQTLLWLKTKKLFSFNSDRLLAIISFNVAIIFEFGIISSSYLNSATPSPQIFST